MKFIIILMLLVCLTSCNHPTQTKQTKETSSTHLFVGELIDAEPIEDGMLLTFLSLAEENESTFYIPAKNDFSIGDTYTIEYGPNQVHYIWLGEPNGFSLKLIFSK